MAHFYIYVSDTLNFDLKQAGFMSSLPYLVMAVIMQFAGGLADWLRNTERLTTTQVSLRLGRIYRNQLKKLFQNFSFHSLNTNGISKLVHIENNHVTY